MSRADRHDWFADVILPRLRGPAAVVEDAEALRRELWPTIRRTVGRNSFHGPIDRHLLLTTDPRFWVTLAGPTAEAGRRFKRLADDLRDAGRSTVH